jgi:hypothetical protein
MATDQIKFARSKCGSKDFIFPNQPPKDDDIISCNGCKREIGTYAAVREATTNAAKAEVDKIIAKTLGIKAKWTKG